MSKYEHLWRFIGNCQSEKLTLTFEELGKIAGIPIDHSFLLYKNELTEYGYKVDKISRKTQTVSFHKLI